MPFPRTLFILVLVASSAVPAAAHESRPGYLEFTEISPERYDILWKQPARGELILKMDRGNLSKKLKGYGLSGK